MLSPRWSWVFLIVASFLILLSDGSFRGDQIALLAFLISIVGILLGVMRQAWLRYRSPLAFTYLVPQRHYRLKDYEGANENERRLKSLTIRPGTYLMTFIAKPRREIDMISANLRFVGDGCHSLEDHGADNPFVIERRAGDSGGLPEVLNWHGERMNPVGHTWPANEDHVLGHRITASEPFDGRIEWVFRISGRHRPLVIGLPLRVTEDGDDDIPFLRVDDASPRTTDAAPAPLQVQDREAIDALVDHREALLTMINDVMLYDDSRTGMIARSDEKMGELDQQQRASRATVLETENRLRRLAARADPGAPLGSAIAEAAAALSAVKTSPHWRDTRENEAISKIHESIDRAVAAVHAASRQ